MVLGKIPSGIAIFPVHCGDFLGLVNFGLQNKFHILPHTPAGPLRVGKNKAPDLQESNCLRRLRIRNKGYWYD